MSTIMVRESARELPEWISTVPPKGTWRYVMHNEYGEMMVVDFIPSDLSLRVASEDHDWKIYAVRDLKGEKLAALKKAVDPNSFVRAVVSDDPDPERPGMPNGLMVSPVEAHFILSILSILKS
jgi:hypothetical protein